MTPTFGFVFSTATTSAPLTSASALDIATPPNNGSQHPSVNLTPSSPKDQISIPAAVVSANVPANNGESPAPIDDTSLHPQPFSGQETPTTLANTLINNLHHVDPTPMYISSGINKDVAQLSISSPQPDSEPSAHNDVAMCDGTSEATPSNISRSDEELPRWLVPMIGYLRSVAEDMAWQDLVMEFVEFEKCEPPMGVSFHFC